MTASPAEFGLAALLVLVMGVAIQRSTTCTVAAVEEIVSRRRASRAMAMLLAGLWVGALLLLADRLDRAALVPPGAIPIPWQTAAGAVLLGFGSVINRACVIGSVGRLGSGEGAFLFTPIGLFAGFLAAFAAAGAAGVSLPMQQLWQVPVPAMPSPWLVLVLLLWLSWRAWRILRLAPRTLAGATRPLWRNVWSPLGATSIIGISFAILLLLAGAWSYPEMLARLASDGGTAADVEPFLLFLLLLAGSALGGWRRNGFSLRWPCWRHCLRAFAGGFVMALGSVLIPGSNDGLVLLGIPLMLPHAMLALPVMALTIAAALLLGRRLPALRPVVGLV